MIPISIIRNRITIAFFFCCFTTFTHLLATPSCQIVTENFSTQSDGTTNDNRSVGWTIDASQIPNALYFAVKSHRFHAEELGSQGIWYSKVMTVTGKPNFQVGVKITAEGDLRTTEYVKIYYKLNGGAETLLEQRTGNFGTIDFQSGLLNANTVQIVVKLYNYDKGTSAKSVYYIEEYRLFSNVSGCSLQVRPVSSGVITCSTPSVILSPGANTSNNVTYSWSGPNNFTSTDQNPLVTIEGTYNVTATIASSASTANGSVIVLKNTASPGVNASANGTLQCSSQSVVITGSSATLGVTYNWTGPGSYTSNKAIDTIHIAGIYTVTATSPLNGCKSSSSVIVAQGTVPPAATASVSGPLTCTTTSVALSASSTTPDVTYSWSGPDNFLSAMQNPVTSIPGTYILTVKDPATSCTSLATVAVVQSETLPGATANVSGPINCLTNSVTLLGNSATSGVTYSWSGSGNFTSILQNPVVSVTGIYTLTVTNLATGCKSSATTNVIQNTIVPGAGATANGELNCTNSSVILAGSSSTSGVTYSWSGPNGFTSTAQNPSVNTAGTYNLKVTNPTNGCNSTASTTVLQNGTLPGASAAVSGILTCSQTSVTLSGSSPTAGVTYSWSGPNSFTSTVQNPTVSAAGSYTLKVTNPSNACASFANVIVGSNVTAPGATSGVSGTLTCNTSVTLLGNSGTSGVNYSWNGPNNFTSTAQNPQVINSGAYILTVINPGNGCTSSSSVNVAASTATASDFWVENFTFNNGTTVDNGNSSWSIQNPGSGTFSVQNNEFMAAFSAANEGIWSSGIIDISSRKNVVVSAYLRSATASTNDYFESDDYIRIYYKLNGGSEILIFGDAAGLNGADNSSSNLTITSPAINGGTLQIIIRARNSSTTERYYFDNIQLNGIPITTGINASASVSGTLTCANTTVILQGSSTSPGVTYSWTGPNSFTSALQNPSTTNAGAYVLKISNSAGCSASAIVNVKQNIELPGAIANVNGTITCTTPSVNLTGSSATSGVTYNWSGPEGFNSTMQNPSIAKAGTYLLTVTNPSNGCSSTQSVLVNSTAGTTSTLWLEDFTLTNGSTADNGTTSWSIAAPSGTFSVNNNEFRVSGTGAANESVWTSGTINITGKTNITVSADLRSSGVVMNTSGTYMDYIRVYYKLNGGSEVLISEKTGNINNHSSANTSVSTASLSGNSIQIIIRARASGSDEFYYFDNIKVAGTSVLNAIASATGKLGCTINTISLLGNSNTSGVSYNWSGPGGFVSSLQNPVVSIPGVYTLTITDPIGGCIATDTAKVLQNLIVPGALASSDSSLSCKNTSIKLSGNSSTPGVTYRWSGPGFTSGLQSPWISNTGTYTLTVNNPVNGCTSTAHVEVTRDTISPSASATVNGTLTCSATSVSLSGNSAISPVTYKWSGPGGFTSTSQNPSVSTSGSYTLTVTNPANGCTSIRTVQVVSNTGATGTIWNEQFPHANGANADNGITSWSVNSSNGTFAVYDNEFKVTNNGTSSQGIWTSEEINISGKTDINISADVRSAITGGAVMNTSGTYMDYIRFYYKLNGGSEVLFAEKLGEINCHSIYGTTVSVSALHGNTIRIIIKARASGPDEFYYFDNVKIIGSGQIDASASVSGSLTCTDTNVTLAGNSSVPGVTYEWSGPGGFTSTSQKPVVGVPGTYSLIVTDPSNGCSSVVNAIVLQNIASPGASASVSGQLSCSNALVTLSGNSGTAGVTYSWSGPLGFTSALKNPSANTLGTYNLTVTNPLNECTSIASVEVTAAASNPATTFWLEDFTFANGTTLDNGTTSWSLQNPGSGTFSVQSNEFMASFGAANEGFWLSGIIDISAKSNIVISVDLKSGTASTSDYLESDDYIRVFYKLDGGPEILMYEDYAGLGTTTNTAASATVTSGNINAGTLQVIIRARNSHSTERYYFDNVKLTGSDQTVGTITTSVSGPITCPNPVVQLTASTTNTAATYYWIRPDNTIINQQNITVNSPGNYNVVVSAGGCQASKTVIVNGSTKVPDISISGGHLACSSNVPAVLSAISSNTNLSYSWSGPSGFNSNLNRPSVLNAGTYSLTVTDQTNLCSNIAAFTVQFGTLIWNEEFNGLSDGTMEDLGSTAWSVNNSKIHTVDLSAYSGESGIPYYFEVRDDKLAAKSTRGEVVWTSNPINISGVTNVFARMDVNGEGTLNDSTNSGKDYWEYDYIKVYYKVNGGAEIPFSNFGSIPGKIALSGLKISSNIPGGNTLQIVVKAYNTGNNEVFYFDNIQVLALGQGAGDVNATVSGPITCNNGSVTLTASPNIQGNSYMWSGPGGFTSNDAITTTDRSGTYTLIVEGNTGCVSSDTVSIYVASNITTPALSVSSVGTLTCSNNSVILEALSGTPNTTITWTGFASGQNYVTVTLEGKYIVTAKTNTNGCTKKDSVTVIQNKILPGVSVSVDDILTCDKTMVTLSATSPTNGVRFEWSGPENYHSTEQNAVTTIPGNYSVTAINPLNGCSESTTKQVLHNFTVPANVGVSVTGPISCAHPIIQVMASSSTQYVEYKWSGPENFSSVLQSPFVGRAGTYFVTVTHPLSECTVEKSVNVNESTIPPDNVTTSASGELSCSNNTVTLYGSTTSIGVSYNWSGPMNFASDLQSPVVSKAGKYYLTVANSNGCSAKDSVVVLQDTISPSDVLAETSGILDCNNAAVILYGSSSLPDAVYLWEGPEGFSSPDAITMANIPGKYILTATNSVNGCSRASSVVIILDDNAPVCNFTNYSLPVLAMDTNIISSSTFENVDYSWSLISTHDNWSILTGEQTRDLKYFAGETGSSATIALTLTSLMNGCSSSCEIDFVAGSPVKSGSVIMSIADKDELSSKVLVYPNPFNEKTSINFTATEDSPALIELFGESGSSRKILFTGTIVKNQIYSIKVDGSDMPSGTYYYVIKTRNNKYTGRILLIK